MTWGRRILPLILIFSKKGEDRAVAVSVAVLEFDSACINIVT